MISSSSIIVFFILVLDCLTSISHVRLNNSSKPRVSLEKCKKFSQIDYLPMSSFGFIKMTSPKFVLVHEQCICANVA